MDSGHCAHTPTLSAADGLAQLGLPVSLRLFYWQKLFLFDRGFQFGQLLNILLLVVAHARLRSPFNWLQGSMV